MSLTTSDLDGARRDVGVFAELLLGAPLWDYQLEAARSAARFRVICAGRQVGKSRLLAVLALHQAFSRAGSTTLVVSAGEDAAKRLMEDVTTLVLASPMLAGSVVDESSKIVTLSNGSTIRAVPASTRQIRGWSIDLLIVDEAAFLEPEVWSAAQFTILARPGSRVLLTSSPWGGPDHFFRVMWNRGMTRPDGDVAAWHWPSTVSPMVDDSLLELYRETEPPLKYAREVMAEWVDGSGAYFTTAELEAATSNRPMVDVGAGEAPGLGFVAGGVDWGMARDAHALSVVAAVDGDGAVDGRGRQRYRIAYVEERFGVSYEAWIDRLEELAGCFRFSVLTAETNGVGQMPTQVLARRLWEASGAEVVAPVATTARLKEDLFGFAKLLIQQGRLELPRHPSLLKQLGALEFTQGESGVMRIAVPERAGHDDVAMSFALSLRALIDGELVPPPEEVIVTAEDLFDDLADHGSYVPRF